MEGRTALSRQGLGSGTLLLVGGGYLWYGLRYPLETLENPGPGVFPLAVGLLLVVLSALQLILTGQQLRHAGRTGMPSKDACGCPADAPHRSQTRQAPWRMVGVLVLYLVAVNWIGFLTCTFVLVVICTKCMGTRGWLRPLALASSLVLASYVLFSVWLKVPLPTGYLM